MPWKNKSRRRQELPKNWPQIRARILERDHHTCVECGQPATDVDHITRGNNHEDSNLRSLCHHCHMQRTGRDGGHTKRRPKRIFRQPEPHPAYRKD